jgi:hypothetical protein
MHQNSTTLKKQISEKNLTGFKKLKSFSLIQHKKKEVIIIDDQLTSPRSSTSSTPRSSSSNSPVLQLKDMTIDSILLNKTILLKFEEYLKKEHNEYLLHFLLEAQLYLSTENHISKKIFYKSIINKYIKEGAPNQIEYDNIQEIMNKDGIENNVFENITKQVTRDLFESLQRFKMDYDDKYDIFESDAPIFSYIEPQDIEIFKGEVISDDELEEINYEENKKNEDEENNWNIINNDLFEETIILNQLYEKEVKFKVNFYFFFFIIKFKVLFF